MKKPPEKSKWRIFSFYALALLFHKEPLCLSFLTWPRIPKSFYVTLKWYFKCSTRRYLLLLIHHTPLTGKTFLCRYEYRQLSVKMAVSAPHQTIREDRGSRIENRSRKEIERERERLEILVERERGWGQCICIYTTFWAWGMKMENGDVGWWSARSLVGAGKTCVFKEYRVLVETMIV